jgi:anti-sigma factor RsiW
MTCDLCRTKLDAYLDSELSDSEIESLETHLRECPSCAADSLGRLQMKRLTQAAGTRYSPTPEFRLRIENSIKRKRKPLWAFGRLATAAAAAALIALLVWGVGLRVRHSEQEQAFTELADLHVATLASTNPVDVVSSDRHTVKPWFQGKLPFTFNLPQLESSPFKLIGGRVTYFEHNPSAQLLFEVRKHQLSVFIMQEQPGRLPFTAASSRARQLEFNIETWSAGGLRYVVIGDSSPGDVHELSELLRGAAAS